jgi:penicillin-binding protein 1A
MSPMVRKTTIKRSRRKRKWKRFFAYLTLLLLSMIIAGMTFIGVMFYQVSKLLPAVDVIEEYRPSESTMIYAADGTILAQLAMEKREPVKFEEIPDNLKNATVAKEDRRFWSHQGVDWRGTARALWVNLTHGEVQQGGSTLTQQLARNVFLTQQRTMNRKMQEILLAQQIERQLTKEEVLELYLNQVYYGNQAYGVKAAARVYFNKPLGRLTLSECALLAALPQRPSGYEPFGSPDLAIQQRNLVLDLMAREGYITSAQRDAAKKEPLRLAKRRGGVASRFRAPYFVTDVLRELEERFGRDLLLRGNLKIYTTLDPGMQQAAENALQQGIRNASGQGVNQGAIVLIDLQTGETRAMVGGRNFDESQYNAITQGRRQPGSAFKPIVYATAFELGKLTPNSYLSDTPLSMPGGGRKVWRPQNSDGRFRGSISVTRALSSSINIPAIRAMMLTSPEEVAHFSKTHFGIESPLDPVLPLALGASAIKPIELAKAFSVFATGGSRVEPIILRRVTDRDKKTIMQESAQIVPGMLSEQSAKWINDILRQAVTGGTGKAAAGIPDAHGKTGTTSDHRDAWFIGYTPRYIAVVWVASAHYNEKKKMWEYHPMQRVFGGTVCAGIWANMMKEIIKIDARRAAKNGEANARKEEPKTKTTDSEIKPPSEPMPSPEATEPSPSQEALQDEPAGTPPASRPEEPPLVPPITTPARAGEPTSSTEPVRTRPESQPRVSPGGTGRAPDLSPSNTGAPRAAPPPETISVGICSDTGLRATDYCPEVVKRTFNKGREPKRACTVHRPR